MALSRLLSLIHSTQTRKPEHCIKECKEHRVVPKTKSYTELLEETETEEIRTQTFAFSKDTDQHLADQKSLWWLTYFVYFNVLHG